MSGAAALCLDREWQHSVGVLFSTADAPPCSLPQRPLFINGGFPGGRSLADAGPCAAAAAAICRGEGKIAAHHQDRQAVASITVA